MCVFTFKVAKKQIPNVCVGWCRGGIWWFRGCVWWFREDYAQFWVGLVVSFGGSGRIMSSFGYYDDDDDEEERVLGWFGVCLVV